MEQSKTQAIKSLEVLGLEIINKLAVGTDDASRVILSKDLSKIIHILGYEIHPT